MTLRAAAEQIRAWLASDKIGTWEYMDGSYFYEDRTKMLALLDAALAAEQPQPVCPHIRSSGVGDHATHWCALNGPPAVPEPSEAELPPLPIGEAEVVWHEPDPVMPERPGKIIDASIAFFDAAPLGTHLYTAEQMRAYALRAAAAARNNHPA